jgi:hypothetical protein
LDRVKKIDVIGQFRSLLAPPLHTASILPSFLRPELEYEYVTELSNSGVQKSCPDVLVEPDHGIGDTLSTFDLFLA